MEFIKKVGIGLFGGACIFYSEYSKSGRLLDAFVVGSAAFVLFMILVLIYEALKYVVKKMKRTKEHNSEKDPV